MNEQPLPPELKGRKASEVFLDYIEPFLTQLLLDRAEHGIHEVPTNTELDRIVKIPWLIWNSIVAEQNQRNNMNFLAEMDLLMGPIPPIIKELIDFMKQRKRNDFAQYQYYLGEYQFYGNHGEDPRFRVESRISTNLKSDT